MPVVPVPVAVERAGNGQAMVTPEIREAVVRAVNELGYVPNSAARSLATSGPTPSPW